MLEATSQATLDRIINKLEGLVDRIHGLEKALTQSMVILKDDVREELNTQDDRIDRLEVELAQMKVWKDEAAKVRPLEQDVAQLKVKLSWMIGILAALGLASLGNLSNIVFPNLFRVHPAKAETTIVK